MAGKVSGQGRSEKASSAKANGEDAQVPALPLALYRRYRPVTFAEVKGQDHVTEPLRQALRSGRVHHAYLFSGPHGCGKTTSARILARSLNCEQGPTPDPCGVCASCVALASTGPGSIDVIEIDAASHGGVDDARDLRERAFYAPVSGRFKIYIIDEAHMVTGGGFNALLKLVEEPPPHVKFVFATTEPEKVIATIRSRTHHYPFRLVPPGVLREHFEQILASEGVPFEPSVLPLVIRSAAGSVRDGLSVIDQLIAGADEAGLTYDRAVALLGYSDDRLLDEITEAFAAADGAAVFRTIDRVVEAGLDPRRFATDLLDRLRDLIVLAAVPDAGESGLIDAPPDRLDQLRNQADSLGPGAMTRAAEVISAGLVEMRGATSPRLLLELMCAQVLLPPAPAAGPDLIARLDQLERKLAESGQDRPRQAPAAAGPPARPSPPPAQGGNGPARPAASPPPQRTQPRTGASPAAAEHSATPAARTAPPQGEVDAALLRGRWPEILRAVTAEKRVAGILLRAAAPASLADGVLTLTFDREGEAKGFVSGGYDKELGVVLEGMFGIKPKIMTGTNSVTQLPPARPAAQHGRAGQDAQPAPSARPNGRPGKGQASRPQPAAEAEPDPDDEPAPAELTGMDLIERELGGKVIEEIGDTGGSGGSSPKASKA